METSLKSRMKNNVCSFNLPANLNYRQAMLLFRNIHIASSNYPDAYSLAPGMPNPDTFPLSKTIFHMSDGNQIEVDVEEMEEIMKYQSAKG